MSKIYILQKDVDWFGRQIPAGTRYVPKGKDYWWPVVNDAHCSWGQLSFLTVINNPEWFLPEETTIKNIEEFVNSINEKQLELFDYYLQKRLPPENKSNDSFQWTDELVKEFIIDRNNGKTYAPIYVDDYIKEFKYKKEHERRLAYMGEPKPQAEGKDTFSLNSSHKQAENKPDWEITEYRSTGVTDYKDISELSYIHSVKRLSDGEVFSVGDEVVHKTDGMINTAKILKFVIPQVIENRMWFEFMEGYDYCKDLANFNRLPPQPQKLFTTEDGKDIFEGDIFSAVQKNTFVLLDECRYKLTHPELWWTFSTKEAAEKYIAENKPQPQKEEQGGAIKMGTSIGDFWLHKEAYDKIHAMPKFAPLKEEQRIEVNLMREKNRDPRIKSYNVIIIPSHGIAGWQLPAIKQAIEQVLNGDETYDQLKEKFEAAVAMNRLNNEFDGRSVAATILDEELKWPIATEEIKEAWEQYKKTFKFKFDDLRDGKIKECIEILVNTGHVVEKVNPEEHSVRWYHPYYSQEQVSKICENVFIAARAKSRASHGIEVYKYEDFDHYNSKSGKA